MMKIAGRSVGPEHSPFIIAEVAQSHEGSLGNAFAFAKVAKECGAHAIKFQTHIAAEESTPQEPWRIPFSRQDESRYAYWQRMEFTFEQWKALKEHCDNLGIIFLSSPFSMLACDWLESLNVPAWKVASGEIHNTQLIERMISTGAPLLISTGLARPEEAKEIVRNVQKRARQVALFHCTTRYPTPSDEVGLNVMIDYMASLPGVPVGLSDHSGTPTAGTIASYLGASLIEVHLTLHDDMFGPDVSSSLTPAQLKQLVRNSSDAWQMRCCPVDKDAQIDSLANERSIFGRSLFTVLPLPAGAIIDESNLSYRKPGGGLAYENRNSIIGRKMRWAVPAHYMLKETDVE
jgi:N,N'-diacetyllegionaminate synthase